VEGATLFRPTQWPGRKVNAIRLKTAWRDGTTHIVMSSLEFMQRQAALVPRPGLHRIRFQGCWRPPACAR